MVGTRWYINHALAMVAIVCGYLNSIVILISIVWGVRLWLRRRRSSAVQVQALNERPVNGWYAPEEHHGPPTYVSGPPIYVSHPHDIPRKSDAYRHGPPDDQKSISTVRPLSVAGSTVPWSGVGSDTATLSYQNMVSPGVTRAPSVAAPSYTSRMSPYQKT